jgi:hypothetical protein
MVSVAVSSSMTKTFLIAFMASIISQADGKK